MWRSKLARHAHNPCGVSEGGGGGGGEDPPVEVDNLRARSDSEDARVSVAVEGFSNQN